MEEGYHLANGGEAKRHQSESQVLGEEEEGGEVETTGAIEAEDEDDGSTHIRSRVHEAVEAAERRFGGRTSHDCTQANNFVKYENIHPNP